MQQLEEESNRHQNRTRLNHVHDKHNGMCPDVMVLLSRLRETLKDGLVKRSAPTGTRRNNNESQRVVLLKMSTTRWFCSWTLLVSRSAHSPISLGFTDHPPTNFPEFLSPQPNIAYTPFSLPTTNHTPKQSYYPCRLTGASLFLVGEDATSQLRNNHQPLFSLSPKNDPLSFPFIRQCILTCSLSFPVVFPFISAFLALTWFFPKTVVLPRLSFVPSLCRVTQPTSGSTTIQQRQANKQFKQHVRNQRQQA